MRNRKQAEPSGLITSAQAIGSALGKLANKTGVAALLPKPEAAKKPAKNALRKRPSLRKRAAAKPVKRAASGAKKRS